MKTFRITFCKFTLVYDGSNILPNQELSGAKSALQGGTVGVCSFYKGVGQLPFNCALRSMQMCLLVHIYEVKHLRIKKYEEKMHIEVRKTIFFIVFQ